MHDSNYQIIGYSLNYTVVNVCIWTSCKAFIVLSLGFAAVTRKILPNVRIKKFIVTIIIIFKSITIFPLFDVRISLQLSHALNV